MKRQAKIFLEIDGEGLFTDTLAIADVVNFDCYESIVSSSQRAIAAFKETSPECVKITKIFYYKKRARSNRMNPSRIHNTTDVFRAIAEHPEGDVPIGVQWRILKSKRGVDTIKIEPLSPPEPSSPENESIGKSSEESTQTVRKRDNEPDIPQKKRKTERAPYKTYMPATSAVPSPNMNITYTCSPITLSTPTQIITQKILTDPQMTNSLLDNRSSASPSPDPNKINADLSEERAKLQSKVQKEAKERYNTPSQYQWPDDTRCEIVMSSGGISERQTIPVSLASTVLTMIKDYFQAHPFTRLRSDSQKIGNTGNSHTRLEEMNNAIKERITESKKPLQPIRYLQDAKMEIFKTLSVLNLSKARFDNLLDWLKSLKLEEAKHGKFYLSERNRLGTGLKVQYDTDAEAASKLNQIFRARSKLNVGKTLHPVDIHSTVGLAPKPAEQMQAPVMLLMPGTTTAGIPTSMPQQLLPSNVRLIPQSGVSLLNNVPNTTAQTVTVQTPQLQPNPVTSENSTSHNPPAISMTTNSKVRKKSGPSILRRKQYKSTPKENPTPQQKDPVPMHLYRSYNTESEPSSAPIETFEESSVPFIKTEPVSFSDGEEEGQVGGSHDYTGSATKEPDFGGGRYENIKHILKSDVKMPQASEQGEKQFEFVMVKSEPLDDY